jgi:prolipoprotein diacylglyceryltransferase
LVAGVVGARLSYAAQSLPAFAASPGSLFMPTPSMLDPQGGLLMGLLAATIYGSRKGLKLWPTLDALTPGLAIFMSGLALAHLASGDAFGAPANLPWAIELWGERRHPSQVYELILAIAIAVAVWPRYPANATPARSTPAGLRFLAFLALSAAARLFLETFRGDSTLLAGRIPAAQVLAWLLLALCLWLIGRKWKPSET